jgi:hypothetical protein
MMADLIAVTEAQAWLEPTKGTISTLDDNLLVQVQEPILRKIDGTYDVSGCVSPGTTPELLRTIIAMEYVARYYNRQYSEDNDQVNRYARQLMADAEALIQGIIDGAISLPLPVVGSAAGTPMFYPTDASSLMCPTTDDPSLGPARFSMGQLF